MYSRQRHFIKTSLFNKDNLLHVYNVHKFLDGVVWQIVKNRAEWNGDIFVLKVIAFGKHIIPPYRLVSKLRTFINDKNNNNYNNNDNTCFIYRGLHS